jgi:cytochrome b561
MTDPTATAAAQRYDNPTIWLHWLSATLVLVLWLLGENIDWFAHGDPRTIARSTHITLGVVLALLLVWRIAWRLTRGRRLPAAELGHWHMAATLVHFALYALLVCAVLAGIANVWVRGDNIFNLFTVPAFDPENRALRGRVEDWHETLADALLILALLHAAAGGWHYLRRDGVLARMGVGR